MAKPVVVNVDFCKPLHESMRGCECVSCGKSQAKWLFGNPPNSICSLCFLYKTFWGRNRSPDIAAMVVDVEKQLKTTFLRDSEGNLLSEADATRIAVAVLMTSHMVRAALHSHLRRETVREMVGDEDREAAQEAVEAVQGGAGGDGQVDPPEAQKTTQEAVEGVPEGNPSGEVS